MHRDEYIDIPPHASNEFCVKRRRGSRAPGRRLPGPGLARCAPPA